MDSNQYLEKMDTTTTFILIQLEPNAILHLISTSMKGIDALQIPKEHLKTKHISPRSRSKLRYVLHKCPRHWMYLNVPKTTPREELWTKHAHLKWVDVVTASVVFDSHHHLSPKVSSHLKMGVKGWRYSISDVSDKTLVLSLSGFLMRWTSHGKQIGW